MPIVVYTWHRTTTLPPVLSRTNALLFIPSYALPSFVRAGLLPPWTATEPAYIPDLIEI